MTGPPPISSLLDAAVIAANLGVEFTAVTQAPISRDEYLSVRVRDDGLSGNNETKRPITVYNPDGTPATLNVSRQCPTRPQFNTVVYKNGVTSFYYRPKPGQTIRGALTPGANETAGARRNRVRSMVKQPIQRRLFQRVEYTTAKSVNAKRLPWFAWSMGHNRIGALILSDANSDAYSGIRLPYPPKTGTYAKLLLPYMTVIPKRYECPQIFSHPTIYAKNIFVDRNP